MNVVARNLKVNEDTRLVWAKLFSEDKHAPIWIQAIVTAWFFVTYIDFPGVTFARYLLVLTLLAILVLRWGVIAPNLVKAWPLFTLPVFGLLSFTWSPYQADAIRQGIYLILTPFFIVQIISLLDARRAMRCLMFAGWIAAFMVLPYYGRLEFGGPYPSKNYVALQMNFMMLLSIAAALNKNELTWIRLAAVPFIGMGFLFVLNANSATQLVFAVLGSFGLITLRLMWADIGRLRNARLLVFASGLVILLAVATLVLNIPGEDPVSDFLRLVGRDSTLSGRKVIWEAGRVVQEQHPWFGVGLEGFWQYNVGAAQSINFYDFKPFGTKLTFHNAYMEVRVHLGIIGLIMYIATWVWIAQRTIGNWLASQGVEASALMILTLLVFISTFTESTAWATFNTLCNIMFIASTVAFGSAQRRFEGYVPLQIKNVAQ